jgi:hypothetical protein
MCWAVALSTGAAFFLVNRRSVNPVIDLALLRDRMFSGADSKMGPQLGARQQPGGA